MTDNERLLTVLNQLLVDELTAISQYLTNQAQGTGG
jgi:bacterioferritin (cytochrome b1)